MHTRRQAQQQQQLSSLSIVLPRPPLPRRTPSIRSSSSLHSSPRTPRNSIGLPSPSLFKLESAPRRSTDSWNSSINEGGDDDVEWEWTPEQLALLVKTLDALPSHLLSPFNGPIPPANVLDKISRSIILAKDPIEWPHSVRSTRIMLFKLARGRAEESKAREPPTLLPPDILQPTTNVPKKPLYRQSSMDFINGTVLKSMESIDCLSTRLQGVDRIFPNPALAYTDSPTRYCTPPPAASRRDLTGETPCTPQTPAEARMCTSPAFPLRRSSRLRRSTTTTTGLPTIQSGVPSDCIGSSPHKLGQTSRVKRSDSFSSPGMMGLGHSLKRAPSYGSISGRSVDSRMSIDDQKENSPLVFPIEERLDIYPSSDEEEKRRSNNTKKQKTALKSPVSSARTRTSSSTTIKPKKAITPKEQVHARKKPAKKITRTSSIFGAELPNPLSVSERAIGGIPSVAALDALPSLSIEDADLPPATPHRRLRRVKTTNFPPRLSRRISFGHLSAPLEEESEYHSSSGVGLGSAFQMQ